MKPEEKEEWLLVGVDEKKDIFAPVSRLWHGKKGKEEGRTLVCSFLLINA